MVKNERRSGASRFCPEVAAIIGAHDFDNNENKLGKDWERVKVESQIRVTESPNLGRRICVVGTSGSGKTFVAEALAACLGISYICNGAIIWRANWVPTPHEERVVEMERLTGQDRWTFDGNLSLNPSHSPDQVALRNCDTIVWLDLPRWQVHTQMLFRTINRAITKEPMWHGNIEGWRQVLSNDSMIWWSVKTYRMRRREYSSLFSDPKFEDKTRIRLASRGEVTHWLRTISR